MSADIELQRIQAGLTCEWKKSPPASYPLSSGWTLRYYLRRDGAPAITFDASESSPYYLVSLPPSITETWTPGRYRLIGFFEKGDDRRKTYEGNFEVLPDPTSAVAYDPRRTWAKVCDLLNDYFLGKLTRNELDLRSAAIGAITSSYSNLAELRDFYLFAQQNRAAEEEQDRIESGQASLTDIGVAFV